MYKEFSFQGDLQLKVIQEICWYIKRLFNELLDEVEGRDTDEDD